MISGILSLPIFSFCSQYETTVEKFKIEIPNFFCLQDFLYEMWLHSCNSFRPTLL